MQTFFIDSANPGVIRNIWEKIYTEGLSKRLSGITTNPKALAKYFQKEFNLIDLKELLCSLNQLMERDFHCMNTIIYIQVPHDQLDLSILEKMTNFVQNLDFKVGIKIPHYYEFLNATKIYPNVSFNVTGVSDFSVASKALSYSHLDYVSIIPGRMEEKNINYSPGLNILRQNNQFFNSSCGKSRVIAGSMRTLKQLRKVLQFDCVPTIGESAFTNIIPELKKQQISFLSLFNSPEFFKSIDHDISNIPGTDLSISFFKEMNEVNLLKI